MNPQGPAPSPQTGLALPAPAAANPVAPTGAPLAPAPQAATPAPMGVQAPPAFDTQGLMNNIANYYQIPKQTALANAGVEQNKYNATTAYENQVKAQSEFAKEKLDQSAYKIVNGPNGKVILDPVTGQPVDIGTYVNRTGANPAEVLKDSTNPKDQQFVSDYNNFQQYMNAKLNENNNAEDKLLAQSYEKNNPGLANLNPKSAANLFLSQYGNYFGTNQSQEPATAQYSPNLSASALNTLLNKSIWSGQNPLGNPKTVDLSALLGGTSSGSGGNSLAPPSF